MPRIRIGTRRSPLALEQSNIIQTALQERYPELQIEIIEVITAGDKKQGKGETVVRDKKDWIGAIEDEIVSGEIDLAVHSGKDVPADLAPGTEILPALKRESPLDVLILKDARSGIRSLRELESGSVIGTASSRRGAQLLASNPQLKVQILRGNVATRLAKLREDSMLRGIVLARAGIARLGLDSLALEESACIDLSSEEMLPAVNQGVLLLQFSSERAEIKEIAQSLCDPDTTDCALSERACVVALNADCKSALGVFAEIRAGELQLRARALSHDGTAEMRDQIAGPRERARELGRLLGERMLAAGAAEYI